MRSYELMFVVDPRVSEEEAAALTDDFRTQVEATGGEVVKAESWGRRKLAYEINKLKEGRYFLFYITSENSLQLADVERRLQQSDKVLRYMTVRTDEDLRRAGLPLPTAEVEEPAAAEEGAAPGGDVELEEEEE